VDLIAALRDERSRCHQGRKSWQWQAALGQQDIEENDQQAMLFDDRNDVLHASPASLARYVVTIIRGMVIKAIWARSLTKLIAEHRKAAL
jgi:hypothetical protein